MQRLRKGRPLEARYPKHTALAYLDGQRVLWRLEAFTNATPASWREFFAALPGEPARIVCDAHSGMLKVIEERWPQTEIHLCEWHLRHALEQRFTALLHHVSIDRLRAAYWALNPKAATGVDGVTWPEDGQGLEANLRDLHARVHRGAYRRRPSPPPPPAGEACPAAPRPPAAAAAPSGFGINTPRHPAHAIQVR